MKIKEDHHLYHDDDRPYPFVESPNFNKELKHEYLIMHYTANNNAAIAIDVLAKKREPVSKGVSAHLVIDQEGKITQLVPFDKGAWHAGESHWEGKRWLNRYAIGIELVNDGVLELSNGQWIADSKKIYDEKDILIAKHKHDFFDRGWPKYPEAQLKAAFEVSKLLITHYKLKDILGHEDVADARIGKVDPGPAFPMDEWRERLFDRRDSVITKYVLNKTVQVLEDEGHPPPIKLPPLHPVSPLPAKTGLNVKKIVAEWTMVKIKGKKDGWIRTEQIDLSNKPKAVTLAEAQVYAFQPDPLPPVHGVKTLSRGVQVRILRDENEWILIATLQDVPRFKVVHGWIPKGTLEALKT